MPALLTNVAFSVLWLKCFYVGGLLLFLLHHRHVREFLENFEILL